MRWRERELDARGAQLAGALAAQVAEERRRRGLSQRQLAELCGTTQSAIARLESGARAPRLDTLLRVANALDCELRVDLRTRTRLKEDGP
jgi:transcriptional regulator with XRE-family HTH domain